MKHQLLALAVLATCASPVWSAECELAIEGNDAMQYNAKSIVVPKSCSQYTVTLKHVGKMAKNVMGHNFVLAKSADMAGINADGVKAGLAADYLKSGDARVIAHGKVVGPGESTSVSIPVARLKADEAYTYFCSFPGHLAIMNGTLKLGD
jgi:azurin